MYRRRIFDVGDRWTQLTSSKLWNKLLFPNGAPLLIGLLCGILVAQLIVRDLWVLGVGIILTVPGGLIALRYPFVVILCWFFLMPFLPPGGVHPAILWVVHRALIPLGLIIHILSRILRIRKFRPPSWSWAEWSMVAYLLFALISIFLTIRVPKLYVFQLYDRMLVAFAAYWLAKLIDFNETNFKHLVFVAAALCIAEIIFGFWAKYLPDTLPPVWRFSRMGERMSGSFSNPTPYAYTLILCMVLIFHYALNFAGRTLRLFLLFVFIMGMACIFLTFTRGCWLSAIIVLLGLATMYPKTVLTILAIVIPVAVPLAGGVLADEVAFALERLNTQETVDSRVILAHAGQQMFYQKPIFGWGFSNYDRYDWLFIERAGSAVPTLWDIRYGTSHNTYLTVLAETGVVGFFLQFFPVFWWLGLTIKVFPRMPRTGVWGRDRLVGLWLSILFYITSSQVVDMRFFWYHIGLLWLTLGLIATIVQAYLPPPAAITPLWMQLAAKPKQSRM